MHLNTITNQTIALAGIAQAATLAQQLATTGRADEIALSASIGSILKVDSESVTDIYNGLEGIRLGLTELSGQLTGHKIANPEQARYAASLVFLEKQLSNQPNLLKTISIGIDKASAQAEHFGLLHENVIASLGDVYHSTVSTLKPRIMVNGQEEYLSNPNIVNKIRSVLLAGIRSALLWRQCGGSRWRFIIFRKKLQTELQNLLKQIH